MKEKIKKLMQFVLNPRLILCLTLAWMMTNGWSYILLGVGMHFDVNWMIGVASGYLAFLWLPISPEKVVTFAIAIALLQLLFPSDTKTLEVLKKVWCAAKEKMVKRKLSGQRSGRKGAENALLEGE